MLIDALQHQSHVEIEIICFGNGNCRLQVEPWPAAHRLLQPAGSACLCRNCSDRQLCPDKAIVHLNYLWHTWYSFFHCEAFKADYFLSVSSFRGKRVKWRVKGSDSKYVIWAHLEISMRGEKNRKFVCRECTLRIQVPVCFRCCLKP